MEFVFDYLLFLAQAVTVVVAVIILLSVSLAMSARGQSSSHGSLHVRKLNDRLNDLQDQMSDHLYTPEEAKRRRKARAKSEKTEIKRQNKLAKQQSKAGGDETPINSAHAEKTSSAIAADHVASEGDAEANNNAPRRIFVLHFDGDVEASAVEHFRLEVTAVLTMATKADEVVVCVDSPGGMVHGYGLAASQMMRIRAKGIPLTAVVDKVAASGGYLMAAVANKIYAAPFAVIGSIGVVAQVPNLHRLLKKNDVDVEVHTAGKYKRTLTLLGENTEEGREKFREELAEVHTLFQEFVVDNRPSLDIDAVSTGEAWYGTRALAMHLIDGLSTSDEYLTERCERNDVYLVSWVEVKRPLEKLVDGLGSSLRRINHLLEFVKK